MTTFVLFTSLMAEQKRKEKKKKKWQSMRYLQDLVQDDLISCRVGSLEFALCHSISDGVHGFCGLIPSVPWNGSAKGTLCGLSHREVDICA